MDTNSKVRELFHLHLVGRSLALIELFDTRDRLNIGRYQEEIAKLNGLIEERRRTRTDLEKLLAP